MNIRKELLQQYNDSLKEGAAWQRDEIGIAESWLYKNWKAREEIIEYVESLEAEIERLKEQE